MSTNESVSASIPTARTGLFRDRRGRSLIGTEALRHFTPAQANLVRAALAIAAEQWDQAAQVFDDDMAAHKAVAAVADGPVYIPDHTRVRDHLRGQAKDARDCAELLEEIADQA